MISNEAKRIFKKLVNEVTYEECRDFRKMWAAYENEVVPVEADEDVDKYIERLVAFLEGVADD